MKVEVRPAYNDERSFDSQMQTLIISLALFGQVSPLPETRTTPISGPVASETAPLVQAQTPPVPGKNLPEPVPPPNPVAPAKVLPGEPGAKIQATVDPRSDPIPEVLGPVEVTWVDESQGLWAYGQQIQNGPQKGKWKYKEKYFDPTKGVGYTFKAKGEGVHPMTAGDPYGFVARLNALRAQHGLPAVGYDPNAEAAAQTNNSHQLAYGLGHHYTGGYAQNAAAGIAGPDHALQAWMDSGAHQALLLSPTLVSVGYAENGGYASLNATGHYGYAGSYTTGYGQQYAQASRGGLFGGLFRRR